MALALLKKPLADSSRHAKPLIPAALRHPGAYRARACVIFLAASPGASNKTIAAGIGVSHLGQVSELLARLAAIGLLAKHAGGPGLPNEWRLTPQGEQFAHKLAAESEGAYHKRGRRRLLD